MNTSPLSDVFITEPTLPDVPAIARMHVASWMATYRGVISDAQLDTMTPEAFEKFHVLNFKPAEHGGALADPARVYFVARKGSPSGDIIGLVRAGLNRDKSPRNDPVPREVFERFSSELYAIYILPELIGSGLGRRLLAECTRGLISRGHTSLCVWVLDENKIGRRFYERLGGVITGHCDFTLDRAYPQTAYGWNDLNDLLSRCANGRVN